eukprot:TRINITY_DN3111_c0_g3_i1.p1 TRINITY_DN3111_c0_g3~~TRINITY_DN3111_c0_g3_i1.p1  ORF type:complete len:203 (-),score=7.03 TRINITY_DN3111_c0_g3_i1:117-725(-)
MFRDRYSAGMLMIRYVKVSKVLHSRSPLALSFSLSPSLPPSYQMPYVYRRSGMALGTLWLLLFLYATDLSLKLLIKSGARMHLHSYPALAFRFYGKWGEIFVVRTSISLVPPTPLVTSLSLSLLLVHVACYSLWGRACWFPPLFHHSVSSLSIPTLKTSLSLSPLSEFLAHQLDIAVVWCLCYLCGYHGRHASTCCGGMEQK